MGRKGLPAGDDARAARVRGRVQRLVRHGASGRTARGSRVRNRVAFRLPVRASALPGDVRPGASGGSGFAGVLEGRVREFESVDAACPAASSRLSRRGSADLSGRRYHGKCVARRAGALSQPPRQRADEIVSGMRSNFEGQPETVQVRVLAFEERGMTDFLGSSAPGPTAFPLDLKAFGSHAAAMDLVEATYARIVELCPNTWDEAGHRASQRARCKFACAPTPTLLERS